jgi:Tfp pilus assembly protein PilX
MESQVHHHHNFKRMTRCFSGQGGFALIAALLVTMILMALGVMVLQLTGLDIQTSAAVVADVKATAAAEAGVHQLTLTFNPKNEGGALVASQQAHPYDTSGQYTISVEPHRQVGIGSTARLPGFSSWTMHRYIEGQVTGTNVASGSTTAIEVGLGVVSPQYYTEGQ